MLPSTLKRPVSQAPAKFAGIVGDRDDLVAAGKDPELGGRGFRGRLGYRLGSLGTKLGHERHPKVGDATAQGLFAESGCSRQHVRIGQAAGKAFQRLTALFLRCHPHLTLKAIVAALNGQAGPARPARICQTVAFSAGGTALPAPSMSATDAQWA